MNPIAVAELTQLGSSILRKGISSLSKTENLPTTPSAFADKLKGAESALTRSELNDLKTKLLNDSYLSDFFNQNTDNTIHLDKLADGSMRLTSSSGDFITLPKGSTTGQLAMQFHDASIKASENLSPSRENSVLLVS
jgi:hypothetical protein